MHIFFIIYHPCIYSNQNAKSFFLYNNEEEKITRTITLKNSETLRGIQYENSLRFFAYLQ